MNNKEDTHSSGLILELEKNSAKQKLVVQLFGSYSCGLTVTNEEVEVFRKYPEVFPHPSYDFWEHYQ